MPNQPDPDKATMSVRIPRSLYMQLKKFAEMTNRTISEVILDLVGSKVNNVPLTSKDYEQIARDVKRAEERLRKY